MSCLAEYKKSIMREGAGLEMSWVDFFQKSLTVPLQVMKIFPGENFSPVKIFPRRNFPQRNFPR